MPAKPLPKTLKGDTAKLYDYLRQTGGICTLHTSASDQGTNWEDPHDPHLEPFVELFQGFHASYEAPGAARLSMPRPTDPRPLQARRLRLARAGQGLSSRLPGLERPYLDARELCVRPGGGVQPEGLVDAMKKPPHLRGHRQHRPRRAMESSA